MTLSIIILILVGFLSAIIGSLVGIGGGIIIVPTLIYFGVTLNILGGITPQTAIGTSSIILIATGLSSTVGYLKQKQVDVKNGIIFTIGIIPGALIGAYLSQYLTLHSFNLYFGMFLILISVLLMVRHRIPPIKAFQQERYMKSFTDAHGEYYRYGVVPTIAIIASFIIGLTARLIWHWRWCIDDTINVACIPFPTPYCSRDKYDDDFLLKCDWFHRSYYVRSCVMGVQFDFDHFKLGRRTIRCEIE